MAKTGAKLQDLGSKFSLGLTVPLTGLGFAAIGVASDMETLKTSLDTVFKGDQKLSTKAFEEIKEFASTTPFQLQEVATAFVKLKNLGLDPSIDSLTSYGNTASALGKSLDQMIEAVADASVGEFERLKEFGIKAKSQGDKVAFTFQGVTTTVSKNSDKIQEYLLNIGNVNFAGSIDRQANTFKGKLSTLKDNIAQAAASIGEILIGYIAPFFEVINEGIKSFQELSPETKKFIVILGGILAAIGPVLLAVGSFVKFLPLLSGGLSALGGPVALLIAGLAAVAIMIIKNWAPIKKVLIDIANYFIDLYNESTLVRVGVEGIVFAFKSVYNVGVFVFDALGSVVDLFIDNVKSGFTGLGQVIKGVLTLDYDKIEQGLSTAFDGAKNSVGDFVKNIQKDIDKLGTNVGKDIGDAINNIVQRKPIKFVEDNVDTTALESAVKKAVDAGLGGDGSSAGRAQVQALPQLESNGINLDQPTPLSGVLAQLPEQRALVDQELLNFQLSLLDFEEQSGGILEGAAESFAVGFGNIIAGIAQGANPIQGLVSLILNTIGDLLTQLGKAAISIGITMTGIKKAFTSPLGAIAAGVAAIALGAIIKSFIPQSFAGSFANGGVVGGNSFTGDKLFARINSGEMVLNQKQQANLSGMLAGSGSTNVNLGGGFELKGDTLKLLLKRTDQKDSRRS